MIYNVNFNLENQVRRANNEAALTDATLAITSSVVTDMQNIDSRRKGRAVIPGRLLSEAGSRQEARWRD